jgi:type I restriction enzyme S subunit
MKYEYSNSEIEWIGKYPKHWKVYRISQRVESIVGGEWGSDPDTDDTEGSREIVVLRVSDFNDIYLSFDNLTLRRVKETKIPNRLITSNCLIMEKSGGGEKQLVGRVAEAKDLQFEAITSNFIAKLEFDTKVDSHFMNYVFHDLYNSNVNFPFVQQTTGIQNINSTYYLYTKVPFPPKYEQIAIANHLDKVCLDIERVIEIKRTQLEQTQLMFFAFLDEIFENIGDNWVEDRIKDVSLINPSQPISTEDKTLVSVVPMEAVSEFGEIDNSNICEYQEVIGGLNYFQNGDVIFAKITPCMENGKGAFVENLQTEIAFGSTEFFVVRPSGKLLGKYIYYFTRTLKFRQEAEANMKGAAGQQRVVPRNFYNAKIQFPKTIKEQNKIIDKIEYFKTKNFHSVNVLEKQIETLVNYKKSLIHEVVTGKKQVYGLSKEKSKLQTA